MKTRVKETMALLLAILLVSVCFAGCAGSGTGETGATTESDTAADSENETTGADEIAAEKERIGKPDWGKKAFTCLVSEDFNRVYEMSFYFVNEFRLYELFRNDVCNNTNVFSSKYKSMTKNFDSKVQKLFKTLDSK